MSIQTPLFLPSHQNLYIFQMLSFTRFYGMVFALQNHRSKSLLSFRSLIVQIAFTFHIQIRP